MTTPGGAEVQARAVRTLARVLLTTPVALTVVVLVVLPLDGATQPPLGLTATVLALVGVGFVAASTIGRRVVPLPPGVDADEARRLSLQRYQTSLLVRFVMTEAPLVVALALSFTYEEHGPWPFLAAVVPGLLSMAFHTWPGPRSVERARASLEADGVRSHLPETMGA